VTLRAPADTLICETDNAQLYVNTDALRVVWTPAGTLDNASAYQPVANPGSTTTYQVTGYIGGCPPKTDDVTVSVAPYPIANAGPDTLVCYGTSAQLNGSMTADVFTWTPGSTLTGSGTLSPVAGPLKDTADYILTVRHTGAGECPKPVSDVVRVNVLPKIQAFAGRDTAVVVTQPLQFFASGGVRYQWSPATQLNNTTIPDPIGVYMGNFDSIRYRVLVYNEANCVDSAFIKVSIYRIVPQVVVPTAFTPNRDGTNDTFKPIAVGIARIEYFSVYNRWGQQVFTTTINGHGWDGRIKGKEQGTGTYAWLVKGIDYQGKPFFAKGTVTLIR
jgi:gliding motility-associated-like protein